MKVLVVKLSSLGDVVHTMPAVQDIRRHHPGIWIDWAVERAFAPLVDRCERTGRHAIACEMRKWRKAPLSRETRAAWRSFRDDLHRDAYDAVLDLQGLTKSALVARMARLATGGRRFAFANRTAGSGYEAPTRWVADVAVPVPVDSHAVERARHLCAQAFGYPVPDTPAVYGLRAKPVPAPSGTVLFVHGTSREDKQWPVAHWIMLGRQLAAEGLRVALVHGSDVEEARSVRIAEAIGVAAAVWPRLALDAAVDRMAGVGGVIGVDSGLSHIAVALGLPHVQVYNVDTAWRTGPIGVAWQRSVFASPTPSVDAVRAAWQAVTMPG